MGQRTERRHLVTFNLSYPGTKTWEGRARLASSGARVETHTFLGVCKLQFCSVPSDPRGTHPGSDELASEDEQVSEELDEQVFAPIHGRGKSLILSCPRLPPPRSTLRMNKGTHWNTAERQSVRSSSPRQKDSSVPDGEQALVCSAPGMLGIPLPSAGLLAGPAADSGCPILLNS